MTKTTTRLYDLLSSEFDIMGLDRYRGKINGKTQLTTPRSPLAWLRKMRQYDADTKTALDNAIFVGYNLPSNVSDNFYKKTFVNKFLNREIGQQTIESFSAQVIQFTMQHETEIDVIANELRDYYAGVDTDNSEDKQLAHSASNSGMEDLPQDTFNYDLKKNEMPTASSGAMVRGESDNVATHSDTHTTANATVFKELNRVWERIFEELDRQCFLQILF